MTDNNKSKRLLDAMGSVNESFIKEAAPKRKREKVDKKKKLVVLAASFAAFAMVFNLWLFIPYSKKPNELKEYRDSEYYDLIVMLDEMTVKRGNSYKNNFEMLTSTLYNMAPTKAMDAEIAIEDGFFYNSDPIFGGKGNVGFDAIEESVTGVTTTGKDDSGSYVEVTDNQVSGVTEADRIKRTTSHIFYLHESNYISAYTIEGADSSEIGSYKLPSDMFYYEFYLSNDGKYITLIGISKSLGTLSLISLDVSDPKDMKEVGSLKANGMYASSRVVGDSILLMTNYTAGRGISDYNDISKFVPGFDSGNGYEYIPASDICLPESANSRNYTVISILDEATLTVKDTLALFNYTNSTYVSADTIYVSKSGTRVSDDNIQKTESEIIAVSYDELSLTEKGRVTVEGTILDQYSMDQKDDMLRVVTTTSKSFLGSYVDQLKVPVVFGTSASIFVIDTNSFEVISSVNDFAPTGETVRSVRFDGDDAYVCTAVKSTDPVFLFDLSDPTNITYVETGEISGFSTSLITYGDYLLGIGQGNLSYEFKIEIYTEGKDSLDSVDKFILSPLSWATDYKSYFVDRERSLFGVAASCESYYYSGSIVDGQERFYIFEISEDGKLNLIRAVELLGENNFKRCILIDGYFYLFSDNTFVVTEMNTLDEVEKAYITLITAYTEKIQQ